MKQNVKRETLAVGGMSCTGCELKIEEKLKSLPGVLEASASHSGGTVKVAYDPGRIDRQALCGAIRGLGYSVGKTPEKGPDEKPDLANVFGGILVLSALYFILRDTVGFGFLNFTPQVERNMGYGLLFVVGLLTSVHCLAMCGGINLSQCATGRREKRFLPSLLYNSGRVLSYTAIGGIAGAVGSVVGFSGTAKSVVTALSGGFMLLMGLNMLHVFPKLGRLAFRMPKGLGRKLYAGRNRGRGPFYVGLLNGLMPCGPLQAMQLYALGTGSFFAGAFSLLMFALGTVPLMFAFGLVSSLLSAKFTHRMMRASAALVIVLGFFMVGRGLTLAGVSVGGGAPAAGAAGAAKVSGKVQEITTSFENGSYVPISVVKGIPVRWTIRVKGADLNGCNNPMTIPQYGIQKKLAPGDNLIEFTPKESGTVTYTCWMGMIRSTITVVESSSQPAVAPGGTRFPFKTGKTAVQ